MTPEQIKSALDAVSTIEVFVNTSDYKPKTLGDLLWPYKEIIRQCLQACLERGE